ncbi:dihydroneopterin aldolase [Idiomarina sp. PL1-037]|jgi:dihydroneopterin aldolase|uniref:dihydroneopterin aldolase n=1 Tax=unclassified Idiomarina TaxID=2614829 RepID=UPI00294ABA05|nr:MULTISPECIES: dihydroneopterin aldolase [unclassified Idiomarina]MDV6327302.1 dihydroneopterin aldolase [Idiomarina sp. Sol25]WQC52384.1 dihydroneopterin aldolase [Idiomarina sp. PL1-037]
MEQADIDVVSIEGLTVETIIGVYDWEKEKKQRLVLDIQMSWDNQRAATTDNIDDALDYALVSERVSGWVAEKPRQLIETVAEGVASLILNEFGVQNVEVRVAKPGAVPNAKTVAVSVRRSVFDSPFG